jgi:hypothetical protein
VVQAAPVAERGLRRDGVEDVVHSAAQRLHHLQPGHPGHQRHGARAAHIGQAVEADVAQPIVRRVFVAQDRGLRHAAGGQPGDAVGRGKQERRHLLGPPRRVIRRRTPQAVMTAQPGRPGRRCLVRPRLAGGLLTLKLTTPEIIG